jgi:5-methylcytosine-specific restriction endonuclease McrA
MSDHCIYCKKPVEKNGTKRRRFCKETDCQKKYRLEKYGHVIPTTELKICSTCKSEKPGDEFYIDRGTKHGRTHRCKSCIEEYKDEYGRGKRKGKPRSVRREIGNIKYFEILERDNYRCQDCGIQVTAIYDRQNPPAQEEHYKDTACEIDHIIPRSKPGPTIESNLRVTCRKCNREKGSTSVDMHEAETKYGQNMVIESDTDSESESPSVPVYLNIYPTMYAQDVVMQGIEL